MRRTLACALFLVIVVVLAAACGGSDEPDAAPAGDSSDDPGLHDVGEPGSAPIPSMNLAGDYFRQEEAANAKYKGQVVDIEGLVTEIVGILTAEEVPYVGMTGMSWLLVQCIFRQEEDWTGYGWASGRADRCRGCWCSRVGLRSGSEVLRRSRG